MSIKVLEIYRVFFSFIKKGFFIPISISILIITTISTVITVVIVMFHTYRSSNPRRKAIIMT